MMKTVQRRSIAVRILGWTVFLSGAVGHFWHKYFTAAGRARLEETGAYVAEHWYFWATAVVGVLLVLASNMMKKKGTL